MYEGPEASVRGLQLLDLKRRDIVMHFDALQPQCYVCPRAPPANTYIYVCMYVCMYVCLYVYMYIHIYIYIHTRMLTYAAVLCMSYADVCH